MKANRAKIFSVVMALVLAVTLASVGVVQDTDPASADPGSLKWSEIPIPEEDMVGNYVLWPGSDVGPIAVSPEGDTIFAAVYKASGNWTMMESTDSGYSWRETGLADALDAQNDESWIIDIVFSPEWEYDNTVIVATEYNVYFSDDGGTIFNLLDIPSGTITSLDVALDEDGELTYLTGSSDGVFLKRKDGGFTDQNVGPYASLDAAFSPTYKDDGGYNGEGQIVAVVTDGSKTLVRFKYGDEAWVDESVFIKNHLANDFWSYWACIGFPDDYVALNATFFTGISAPPSGTDFPDGMGDVYKIAPDNDGWSATDLDVRGTAGPCACTETNILSIAVSGDADTAKILVGTEQLIPDPEYGDTQYLVYWSDDGGTTWHHSDKQPTGMGFTCVTMAPDKEYVSTSGSESAFSASEDGGLSWDQRGLIDTQITKINDVAPSPNYAEDGTIYMVTEPSIGPSFYATSLWKTTNKGATWARIYCSTLTNIEENPEVGECLFDTVRLTDDDYIFVAQTGTNPITDKEIRYLAPDHTLWKRIEAHDGTAIVSFEAVSGDILFTGDADGKVWKTTNATSDSINWIGPDESEITGMVKSIAVGPEHAMLVGDDNGRAYICENYNGYFSFEQVGTRPGNINDVITVAFDNDYVNNDIIYAGCNPGGDIYRIAVGEESFWDNITEYGDAAGIDVTGLVVTDDSILYASDYPPLTDIRAGMGVARSVNPTFPMEEYGPEFEMMDMDAWLKLLRVVPGSSILFAVNAQPPYPNQLLTFTDTLTDKVSLDAPDDGATTGDILDEAGLYSGMARVLFSWEEMTGALGYEYEIALDDEFRSIIDTPDTLGTVTDEFLWLGTQYYWRVRVNFPLLSRWSDTRSFTTPLGPGAARPMLESPGTGQVDMPLRTVLEWSGVIDATKYELQVAADCDWANLVVDRVGASALGPNTVYAIPSGTLAYETNYCWRVRALSDTTESPWSDSGTFTTIAEPVVEKEEPTPFWVWVVIGVTAVLLVILLVSWIVLIARTRGKA